MKAAWFLAFVLLLPAPARPAVITVPDQHSSIQNAIVSAAGGDLIVVRPGIYRENIDFLGKAVRLASAAGPHVTTIKGIRMLEKPAVTISGVEDPGAAIAGFTIMGGAGGILCSAASPAILNNRIIDNSAIQGGGIRCEGGAPRIAGNFIASNFARLKGGGICLYGSDAVLVNNIFSKNQAGNSGGAVDCQQSAVTIANCTCVDNLASAGGAVYCGEGSVVAVQNSILWANAGGYNSGEIHAASGAAVLIGYSDIQGWPASVFVAPGGSSTWGPKNINVDPRFVDAEGQDYHLTFESACRDAGRSMLIPAGVDTDFEGDPRAAHAEADIGADEFYYRVYQKGAAAPKKNVRLVVTGRPDAAPVRLLLSPQLAGDPLTTPHGILYLERPVDSLYLPPIPPSGVLEVDGIVPEWWVPGEKRYLQVLVGPYGGPQTSLTNSLALRIENALPPEHVLAYDDGSGERGYGHGVGVDFCWMHRFDTPPEGAVITHVMTAFGSVSSPSNIPDGADCTFFVWEDPGDDGDPTDCILVSTAAGIVADNNTNILTAFAVPPAEVHGVFFVGCLITKGPEDAGAAYDIHSEYGAGRSWYCGEETPGGFNPYDLSRNSQPPAEMTGGHWLLRAGY